MKKMFIKFATLIAVISSSCVAFASDNTVATSVTDVATANTSAVSNNVITTETASLITTLPAESRELRYELVTDVQFTNSRADYITVLNESGSKVIYTINSDTLIIDAITGLSPDYKDIKLLEKLYIVGDKELVQADGYLQCNAQAIIMNVPAGAVCPTLHNVNDITVDENDIYSVHLDGGIGTIKLDENMSFFQRGKDNILYLYPENIQINDRVLIWSSYKSSYTPTTTPYQMMFMDGIKTYNWESFGTVVDQPTIDHVGTTDSDGNYVFDLQDSEPIITDGVPVPEIPQELLENNLLVTSTLYGGVIYDVTPRGLTYETVVSTHVDFRDKIEFVVSTDTEGLTTTYTIDDSTLVIDGLTGEFVDLSKVKSGDKIHIYGNNPKPEVTPAINYAQGIVLNMPSNENVPELYTVIDVALASGGTDILVDDPDVRSVFFPSGNSFNSLITNEATSRTGIAIGNRIFVWHTQTPDNERAVSRISIAPTLEEYNILAEGQVSLPAIVKNNHAYIGLRVAAESVGIKVDWNNSTRTATISTDNRVLDIQVGQTSYVSRPVGENMVGMAAPTILAASFIGEDGSLYVDPEVFEVLGGFIVNTKSPSV